MQSYKEVLMQDSLVLHRDQVSVDLNFRLVAKVNLDDKIQNQIRQEWAKSLWKTIRKSPSSLGSEATSGISLAATIKFQSYSD